jgi:hypothetical protein
MPPTPDFPALFAELKTLLAPYGAPFTATVDEPTHYALSLPATPDHKTGLFFGAVRATKSYVSFHLMPVYIFPDLLDDLSPELRAHMQGKSCFNFKRADPKLFKELARLTKRSAARLKKEKLR